MSRRAIDSRGEKALGVFLDKYFYPKAKEQSIWEYVDRIYEKSSQVKGIDVLINQKSNLDEKAQLYYINEPRDTFAFEIDYLKEDAASIVDGWFINPSNVTDAYLLMWIFQARTKKVHRLVAEDFECVQADFVKKKQIKEYLSGIGITDKRLKQMAIEMRNKKIKVMRINDHCYMVFSMDERYSEKPINIVISKVILDELSERRYEITKERVTLI